MTPDPKYKPLIDAMQEVVDRCDKGEIRSKYTYAKFKEVLKGVEETPIRSIPSSKEPISLAEHDWHNREERKHKHPMSPWVSGWITGFLTPTKPDWSKEREEKVRKDERERIRKSLTDLPPDDSCIGDMNSDECLSYETGCAVCRFDRAVRDMSGDIK